jgi:hypothetical protein
VIPSCSRYPPHPGPGYVDKGVARDRPQSIQKGGARPLIPDEEMLLWIPFVVESSILNGAPVNVSLTSSLCASKALADYLAYSDRLTSGSPDPSNAFPSITDSDHPKKGYRNPRQHTDHLHSPYMPQYQNPGNYHYYIAEQA